MTVESSPFDWMILDRYLNGSASVAEHAALQRWTAENPDRAGLLEALIARRDAQTGRQPAWDLERIRNRINDRTTSRPGVTDTPKGRNEVRSITRVRSRRRTVTSMRAIGFAAAVGLVAVAGVLTSRSVSRRPTVVEPPSKLREYVTERGQRASIYLADGTHVTLAPESRLGVPESIGDVERPGQMQAPREVTLQGGAYFEVAHDATRPFSVRTAAGVALDIGTKFEVRAYEIGSPMKVTVVSGIVALHAASKQPTILATLRRGDRGTLYSSGHVQVSRDVDLTPILGWTEGSLIFNRTPVKDVVHEVSRWYDIDVQLGQGVDPNQRLVLTLDNESAVDALNLIGLSLGLRVEREGRRVILQTR